MHGKHMKVSSRRNSLRFRLVAASETLLLACAIGLMFAPQAFSADSSIDTLETKFFEHSYPKDTTGERLARLEKLVFGEAKTGNESERLKNLVAATQEDGPGATPSPGSGASSTASAPSSSPAASSGGGSSNYGSSSKNSSAPVAQDGKKKARTDSANYPRVNRLETNLLGKTYDGESVEDRITRLEQKAFGGADHHPRSERTYRQARGLRRIEESEFQCQSSRTDLRQSEQRPIPDSQTETGYSPAPRVGVPLTSKSGQWNRKSSVT